MGLVLGHFFLQLSEAVFGLLGHLVGFVDQVGKDRFEVFHAHEVESLHAPLMVVHAIICSGDF